MQTICLLIALLLRSYSAESADENGQLVFVQAIWRHGARAPGGLPYPNDSYNESFWPHGWDQLTGAGVKQMNELGEFFRSRYSPTLDYRCQEDEVVIQSSKSQRAVDSARGFVETFCPENDALTIQLTNFERGDPLLKPTGFDCPAYDREWQSATSNLVTDLTNQYRDLFEFLGPVTGHDANITLHQVAKLNDLNREIGHGLVQPEWVFKRWPQYEDKTTLELVTELRRIERIHQFNRPELARLRGGFILADWLKRAQLVAQGTQKQPSKMMLYSSHDGTLQSLLYASQVADHLQIPYAAALIMEIYRGHSDAQFYVKLFYRHDGVLTPKRIPNCEFECSLSDFIAKLNSTAIFTIELLEKSCELGDLPSKLKDELESIDVHETGNGGENARVSLVKHTFLFAIIYFVVNVILPVILDLH